VNGIEASVVSQISDNIPVLDDPPVCGQFNPKRFDRRGQSLQRHHCPAKVFGHIVIEMMLAALFVDDERPFFFVRNRPNAPRPLGKLQTADLQIRFRGQPGRYIGPGAPDLPERHEFSHDPAPVHGWRVILDSDLLARHLDRGARRRTGMPLAVSRTSHQTNRQSSQNCTSNSEHEERLSAYTILSVEALIPDV
jgi:hypothetical protein